MADGFERYKTARVRNGTASLGDTVRLADSGATGKVAGISRLKPVRKNYTYIEIVDANGNYLAFAEAKRFDKV